MAVHVLLGDGLVLHGKSSTSEDKKLPPFFFFLIFFMIFIVGTSIVALISVLPTLASNVQALAVIVIGSCVLALVIDIYILVKYITKRRITYTRFKYLPCHRGITFLGKEFILCFRCIGFYVGTIFWAAITSMKQRIWIDLLFSLGLLGYIILTLISILSVPIHGAVMRRHGIEAKKQAILRSLTGFVFSLSFYLIAGFIIYLFYRF